MLQMSVPRQCARKRWKGPGPYLTRGIITEHVPRARSLVEPPHGLAAADDTPARKSVERGKVTQYFLEVWVETVSYQLSGYCTWYCHFLYKGVGVRPRGPQMSREGNGEPAKPVISGRRVNELKRRTSLQSLKVDCDQRIHI